MRAVISKCCFTVANEQQYLRFDAVLESKFQCFFYKFGAMSVRKGNRPSGKDSSKITVGEFEY